MNASVERCDAALERVYALWAEERRYRRQLARSVRCRACGARPETPCRTSSGRATMPHGARYADSEWLVFPRW